MKADRGGRAIAFDVLRRVEKEGAFASILLQNLDRSLEPREVHFATELVYGCLRFRMRDEHVLSRLSARPLEAIDSGIAILFRIAAHQILRLDRVPERAAVSEAVEAAKALPARGAAARGRGARGRREAGARFLNAILRRLCREKNALPLPEPPTPASARSDTGSAAQALSILHSHPAWMVRRWIDRLGIEDATALLQANNEPAPLSVRVDHARMSLDEAEALLRSDGVLTRPSGIGTGFLRVIEGAPQRTTAFRRGLIYIQDEASGLIPSLVAPKPGWRVLDACSAPGGKALALARAVEVGGGMGVGRPALEQGLPGSQAGGRGIVVAGDLHPARLSLVAANMKRMRIGNLRLVAGDFAAPPFGAVFDAALVDAPCSGSGVFRRDVESRYRLSPEDLARIAANQRAILDGVASVVRPGGRLVYAVCSIEPEEGPEVVEAFLASREDYARIDLRLEQPHLARFVASDGTLRTWPQRDGFDGFYAAAMRRR